MITKQQQLEWLAENYHDFNEHQLLMSINALGKSAFDADYQDFHLVTKKEWQQERDKMSSKPEVDNSWYERGELPPIGCECLILNGEAVMIVSHGSISGIPVAFYPYGVSGLYSAAPSSSFRPLRTEYEKAIDSLIEIICAGGELSKDGRAAREIAERIHDSGLLK